MVAKTKIVLDADVIIHFIKAERFSLLLDIFPEYEYIILDVVYSEVTVNYSLKVQIDNTLLFFPNRLSTLVFAPQGDSRKEYARLRSSLMLGKGESACLVFCRDNKNVIGSSNLRDIKDYCSENNITYLTTIDFLYYAYIRGKITVDEVKIFISEVITKGSNLPLIDVTTYIPNSQV